MYTNLYNKNKTLLNRQINLLHILSYLKQLYYSHVIITDITIPIYRHKHS